MLFMFLSRVTPLTQTNAARNAVLYRVMPLLHVCQGGRRFILKAKTSVFTQQHKEPVPCSVLFPSHKKTKAPSALSPPKP